MVKGDLMDLLKLASLFRTLQLYTHMAHNLTKGQTFLQDHGQFSDIYSFAESSYDGLIERAIGLGNEANIVELNEKAIRIMKEMPNEDYFRHTLNLIETIIKQCEVVAKGKSLGTNNMIAGLADSLESHVYKLKQKLK